MRLGRPGRVVSVADGGPACDWPAAVPSCGPSPPSVTTMASLIRWSSGTECLCAAPPGSPPNGRRPSRRGMFRNQSTGLPTPNRVLPKIRLGPVVATTTLDGASIRPARHGRRPGRRARLTTLHVRTPAALPVSLPRRSPTRPDPRSLIPGYRDLRAKGGRQSRTPSVRSIRSRARVRRPAEVRP